MPKINNMTAKQIFIIHLVALIGYLLAVGGIIVACALPSAAFTPDNLVESLAAVTGGLALFVSKVNSNKQKETKINNPMAKKDV